MHLNEFLLERQTIRLNQEAANWYEAVRIAVQLLVDTGSVKPEYHDRILANHEKNGPYYVIMPSVAMPHAAPDETVFEVCYSLATLKTPVEFGHAEHDPVDVILCIAAPDRKSLNEKMVVQVMELLDDSDALTALKAAKQISDIEALLRTLY